MPAQYLKATSVENHLQTCVYQAHRRHNECAPSLTVVLLVNTKLHTQAKAQVILCRSDLELPDDTLRDDYRLRFQIEFNFRDAQQSGGLEDFMPLTPTGVPKAANLALCRVKGAYRLQTDVRQHDSDSSLLDLKADGRGTKSVAEPIHMLGAKPKPGL